MRKKSRKQKPKWTDSLLKTSKKGEIELTEKELGKVTGGVSNASSQPGRKDKWMPTL